MYIVILKIFDHKLSESWHSGSSITTEAKWDFKTKKEAKEYVKKLIDKKYATIREDTISKSKRYSVDELYLKYTNSELENIKNFFKYSEADDIE